MANQRARSPGSLTQLNTQGQVTTKPSFAVDPNAGIWFTTASSLRRAGQTLGNLADRAMQRREKAAIETATTEGQMAGYQADLGTGSTFRISDDLKSGISATAKALQIDPVDLATVISYETKGTFDPTIKGPTTKWGTHRGLIQFGEPQAKQYGVDWDNPIASQLGENGAIVRYLKDAGVKPGMGLLDIYSAINAGSVGKPNASDAAAGGAPGTVRDKVENQMAGHRAKAQQLFAASLPDSTGQIIGRTDEGRPIVRNVDGSVSTERTITITDERINGGMPTNIPTMYGGKIVDDEMATDIIAKNKGVDPDTGRRLRSFNSISEAETAAAARSKELGKQIGQVSPSTGRPSSSGPALALRRGDSPMGEAYWASKNRSIARRYPAEVTQGLDDLYEENKDDPTALAKAFDDYEGKSLGALAKETANDPDMMLLGQQTFMQKRRVYERSAQAAEDARVRDGERSDYDQTIGTARTSLQKQAYLAANDEEAGSSLDVAINENLGSIETALEAGVISPEVATRDRKAILDTVTLGRIDGTFDALPDPESKARFVEGLKDGWAKGEELLKDLSLEQVQALERKYAGAISTERRTQTAAAKLQEQKMQGMIKDDLASTRSTGVGLSIDGTELDYEQVKAVLGETVATNWQHDRQVQAGIYNATAGLDVMSSTEMLNHLEALEPKAGSPGFTDQAAIRDAAQKEATRILKQRKEDPALAVDHAFDDLRALREKAYQGDPVALEEMIKGRLEAQAAIGIPDYAKAPLTNSELASVAMPVAGSVDRQTWNELFSTLDDTYGPYADEVMTQILHWKGLHKEVAGAVTGYLRNTKLGQKPSRIEAQSQGQKLNAITSEQAMNGGFDAVQWKATPNYKQIDLLLANPDLGNRFDDKFGSGASEFYFNAQEQSRRRTEAYRQNLDRQGISINEDGSENYDPAKDKSK